MNPGVHPPYVLPNCTASPVPLPPPLAHLSSHSTPAPILASETVRPLLSTLLDLPLNAHITGSNYCFARNGKPNTVIWVRQHSNDGTDSMTWTQGTHLAKASNRSQLVVEVSQVCAQWASSTTQPLVAEKISQALSEPFSRIHHTVQMLRTPGQVYHLPS